jgi:hypothetical protein
MRLSIGAFLKRIQHVDQVCAEITKIAIFRALPQPQLYTAMPQPPQALRIHPLQRYPLILEVA